LLTVFEAWKKSGMNRIIWMCFHFFIFLFFAISFSPFFGAWTSSV
jgi:hypothetical protein